MRWQSSEIYHGPLQSTQTFSLAETPVFVRVGAVIPLKGLSGVHEVAPTVLTFHVVLAAGGGSSGATRVYEDDGESLAYDDAAKAAFRVMSARQTSNASHTEVVVTPHSEGGGYVGEPKRRAYVVVLHRGRKPQVESHAIDPRSVMVNGVVVSRLGGSGVDGERGWWRDTWGPNAREVLAVGTGVLEAAEAVRISISY